MTARNDLIGMQWCLHLMQMAWIEHWPVGSLHRLDYHGKEDLRLLGEKLIRHGQALVAEAERQEAAYRAEVGDAV